MSSGWCSDVLAGVFGNDDARYGAGAAVAYLGLGGAALGVLVGGILAVLLDRKP